MPGRVGGGTKPPVQTEILIKPDVEAKLKVTGKEATQPATQPRVDMPKDELVHSEHGVRGDAKNTRELEAPPRQPLAVEKPVTNGPPPQMEDVDKLATDAFLLSGLGGGIEITEAETFGDPFDDRWEIVHPGSLAGLSPRSPDIAFEGEPLKGDPVLLQVRLKEPAPGRIFNVKVGGPEVSLRDAVCVKAKNSAKVLDRMQHAGVKNFSKIKMEPTGALNVHDVKFADGEDLQAAFKVPGGARLELSAGLDTLLHREDGSIDKSQVDFFRNRSFSPRLRDVASEGSPSTNEAQAIHKYVKKACANNKPTVVPSDTPVVVPDEQPVKSSPTRGELAAAFQETIESLERYPEIETPYEPLLQELESRFGRESPQAKEALLAAQDVESHCVALREQVGEIDLEMAGLLVDLADEETDLSGFDDKIQAHVQNRNALGESVRGFNDGAAALTELLQQTLDAAQAQEITNAADEAKEAQALKSEQLLLLAQLGGHAVSRDLKSEVAAALLELREAGGEELIEKKGFEEQAQGLEESRVNLNSAGSTLSARRDDLTTKVQAAADTGTLSKIGEKVAPLVAQMLDHETAASAWQSQAEKLVGSIRKAAQVTKTNKAAVAERTANDALRKSLLADLGARPLPSPTLDGVDSALGELRAAGFGALVEKKNFSERRSGLADKQASLVRDGESLVDQQTRLKSQIETEKDAGGLEKMQEKVTALVARMGVQSEKVSGFSGNASVLETDIRRALSVSQAAQVALQERKEFSAMRDLMLSQLSESRVSPMPTMGYRAAFDELVATGDTSAIEKKGFDRKVDAFAERESTLNLAGSALEGKAVELHALLSEASDSGVLSKVSEKLEQHVLESQSHNHQVSQFGAEAGKLTKQLQAASAANRVVAQAVQEAKELAASKSALHEKMDRRTVVPELDDADAHAMDNYVRALGPEDSVAQDLQSQVGALAAERFEVLLELEKSESQFEKLGASIAAAGEAGELPELEQELGQLLQSREELAARATGLNEKSAALGSTIESAQTRALEARADARALVALRAELSSKIDGFGTVEDPAHEFADVFERLQRSPGYAPDANSELQRKVGELNLEYAEILDGAALLRAEHHAVGAEVRDAGTSGELEELASRVETCGEKIQAHGATLRGFNEQVEITTKAITTAITELEQAQQRLSALAEGRAQWTGRLRGLDLGAEPNTSPLAAYEQYEAVVGAEEAAASGLAPLFARLQKTGDSLLAQRQQLQNEISDLVQSVSTAPNAERLAQLGASVEKVEVGCTAYADALAAFEADGRELAIVTEKSVRAFLDAPTIDVGHFIFDSSSPIARAGYTELVTDFSKLAQELEEAFEANANPEVQAKCLHDGLSRLMERNRTRLAKRNPDISAVYELPSFRGLADMLVGDLTTHGTRIPAENLAKGGDTLESQVAYREKLTQKHLGRLSWLVEQEKLMPLDNGLSRSPEAARSLTQCSNVVDTEVVFAGPIRGFSKAATRAARDAQADLLGALGVAQGSEVAKSYKTFEAYEIESGHGNALSKFSGIKELALGGGQAGGKVVAYRATDDAAGARDQVVVLDGVGKLGGHSIAFQGHPLRTTLPGFSEKFKVQPAVIRDVGRSGFVIPFDNYLPLESAHGRRMILVNAGDESFVYEVNRKNELNPVPLDGDPKIATRGRGFLLQQLLLTGGNAQAVMTQLNHLMSEDPSRLAPMATTIGGMGREATGHAVEDAAILVSLAALKAQATGAELPGLQDGTLNSAFRKILATDVPKELELSTVTRQLVANGLGVGQLAQAVTGASDDEKALLLSLYDDVAAPIHVPRNPNTRRGNPTAREDDGAFFGDVTRLIWALSGCGGENTKAVGQARERLAQALAADPGGEHWEHMYIRSLGSKLLCMDPTRMTKSDQQVLKKMRDPHAREMRLALLNRAPIQRKDALTLALGVRKLESNLAQQGAVQGVGPSVGRPPVDTLSLEGGVFARLATKHQVLMSMNRRVSQNRSDQVDAGHASRLVAGMAGLHGEEVRAEFESFMADPVLKSTFDFGNSDGLTPTNLHKKINGQAYRIEAALHDALSEVQVCAAAHPEFAGMGIEDLSDAYLAGTTPRDAALNGALAAVMVFENHLNQIRGIQDNVAQVLGEEGTGAQKALSKAMEQLGGLERNYQIRGDDGSPGIGLFERRLLAFERMFSTQLRESQYEMVKGIVSGDKRFINCGTGFGKTFGLQLVIWSKLLDNRACERDQDKDLVVIQPTENLKEKTKGDYASFGSRAEVNFTLLETPFGQWSEEWSAEGLGEKLAGYGQLLEKGRANANVAWLLSDADELSLRAHHTELSAITDRTPEQDAAFDALDGMVALLRTKCDKYIDEHDNVLSPERAAVSATGGVGRVQPSQEQAALVARHALDELYGDVSGQVLKQAGLALEEGPGGTFLRVENDAAFAASMGDVVAAMGARLCGDIEGLSQGQAEEFLTMGTLGSEVPLSSEDLDTLFESRSMVRKLPALLSQTPGDDYDIHDGSLCPVVKGAALAGSVYGGLETAFLVLQMADATGNDELLEAAATINVATAGSSISRQSLLDCARVTGLSATEGNGAITAALTGQDDSAKFRDPATTRPRLVYQLAKHTTQVGVASGEGMDYLDSLLAVVQSRVDETPQRPLLLVDGAGDLAGVARHELVRELYKRRSGANDDYRVSFFTEDKSQWVFTGTTLRPYEASLDDAYAASTDYYLPPALSEAGTDVRQVGSHVVVSTGVSDLDNETQQIGRGRQLDKGQVLVKVLNQDLVESMGLSAGSSGADLKEGYIDRLIELERGNAPQTQRSSERAILQMMRKRFEKVRLPKVDREVARLLKGIGDISISLPQGMEAVAENVPFTTNVGDHLEAYSEMLWESVESDVAASLSAQYMDCLLETFGPSNQSPEQFRSALDRVSTEILLNANPRRGQSYSQFATMPIGLAKLDYAMKAHSEGLRVGLQKEAGVRFPRNMLKAIGACAQAASSRKVGSLARQARGPDESGKSWAGACGSLIAEARTLGGDAPCFPLIVKHQVF